MATDRPVGIRQRNLIPILWKRILLWFRRKSGFCRLAVEVDVVEVPAS